MTLIYKRIPSAVIIENELSNGMLSATKCADFRSISLALLINDSLHDKTSTRTSSNAPLMRTVCHLNSLYVVAKRHNR